MEILNDRIFLIFSYCVSIPNIVYEEMLKKKTRMTMRNFDQM